MVNVCSLSQKNLSQERKLDTRRKNSRISESNAIAIRVENLQFNQYPDYIVIVAIR